MSKELSLLDQPANLPAHLQGHVSGVSTQLMVSIGNSLNRIGTKGSRFRQVISGEEVGVFDENYLDVIIVGAAPAVSRRYYAGAYTQGGDNAPPSCYSVDGVTPAEDVHQKQATTCAACPQNIKGSKIGDNGAKGKACSYFRRLVIMLAGDPEGMLYRLDVTAMGLFGESQSKAQKYALNDYAKAVTARGLDVGLLVTRLSFDTDQSVPKLLFQPLRYISEDDVNVIATINEGVELVQYLEISMKTVDISKEDGQEEAPPAPAAAVAPQRAPAAKPKPQVAAKPAPVEEEVVEEEAAPPAAQRPTVTASKPVPVQRPAPQKPAPAAAQKPAPVAAQAKPPAPAPVVQEVGSDEELANILGDLGL